MSSLVSGIRSSKSWLKSVRGPVKWYANCHCHWRNRAGILTDAPFHLSYEVMNSPLLMNALHEVQMNQCGNLITPSIAWLNIRYVHAKTNSDKTSVQITT